MESPDISAIAGETESFSTSVDVSSKRNLDSEETVGNSESLLAGISSIVDVDPTPSQSREESQSLLMNVGTGNYDNVAAENSGSTVEATADEKTTEGEVEINNELAMDEDNSEEIGPSETVQEKDGEEQSTNNQEEMETEDFEDENEDTENSAAVISLPFGRVKKIMKICINTNPEEEEVVELAKKPTRKSGKGSKKSLASGNGSTANYLISKEAIYLSAAAAELFISAIAQQSARVAIGAKKKNVTVDHLKRALGSTESYEFLQGCFHPSILLDD